MENFSINAIYMFWGNTRNFYIQCRDILQCIWLSSVLSFHILPLFTFPYWQSKVFNVSFMKSVGCKLSDKMSYTLIRATNFADFPSATWFSILLSIRIYYIWLLIYYQCKSFSLLDNFFSLEVFLFCFVFNSWWLTIS